MNDRFKHYLYVTVTTFIVLPVILFIFINMIGLVVGLLMATIVAIITNPVFVDKQREKKDLERRIEERMLENEASKLKRKYALESDEAIYLAKKNKAEKLRAERKEKARSVVDNLHKSVSKLAEEQRKKKPVEPKGPDTNFNAMFKGNAKNKDIDIGFGPKEDIKIMPDFKYEENTRDRTHNPFKVSKDKRKRLDEEVGL